MYTEEQIKEMRKYLGCEKRELKIVALEHETPLFYDEWLQVYGEQLRKRCVKKVMVQDAERLANSVVNAMFDFKGEV